MAKHDGDRQRDAGHLECAHRFAAWRPRDGGDVDEAAAAPSATGCRDDGDLVLLRIVPVPPSRRRHLAAY